MNYYMSFIALCVFENKLGPDLKFKCNNITIFTAFTMFGDQHLTFNFLIFYAEIKSFNLQNQWVMCGM